MTAFPTSAACVTAWSSTWRHYQLSPAPAAAQDLTRQVTDNTGAVVSITPAHRGLPRPVNAAGAAQMPAGNLDLTNTAAGMQLVSYQQLLIAHNITVVDPTDPTKTIQQSVGPYLNAGSANGASRPSS